MVDLKINLLKKKRGISEELRLKEKRAFVLSLVFFVVVLVGLTGVFGWQFFSARKLDSVKKELGSVEKEINSLREASAQQLYIKDRMKIVRSLLKARSSSRDALQEVFSLDISEALVQGASFETEGMIDLRFKANNSLIVDDVFDYFKKDDYFPRVINKGISRSDKGFYDISVRLYLQEEEI